MSLRPAWSTGLVLGQSGLLTDKPCFGRGETSEMLQEHEKAHEENGFWKPNLSLQKQEIYLATGLFPA